MRKLLPWLALAIIGCGGATIVPNPDPVDVSGSVTLSDKPVLDVVLNLQPTGAGLPAVIPVTDGKFTAKLIPGKYAYFITEGKSPASFKAIPKEFREASLDRDELEVNDDTTSLDIAMD